METRQSHGLDQFCSSLEDRPGMAILDFAGVNQATVGFITNYGHRIYSDDFVRQMDECFAGEGDFFANQTNPLLTARFFANTLELNGRYK